MKNWRKTIAFKEKLDVISQLQKGERIVDICRDIRLARTNVCTIRDNAERIRWTARLGTKVGTVRICYSRRHTIEHMEKKILSTLLEDQNQRHVPVSFWFKRKLFIFLRIHQRIRMMIMPNHSVQVQVALASSQRHNWNNNKMTGELLLMTLWQLKSILLYCKHINMII